MKFEHQKFLSSYKFSFSLYKNFRCNFTNPDNPTWKFLRENSERQCYLLKPSNPFSTIFLKLFFACVPFDGEGGLMMTSNITVASNGPQRLWNSFISLRRKTMIHWSENNFVIMSHKRATLGRFLSFLASNCWLYLRVILVKIPLWKLKAKNFHCGKKNFN